MPNLVVVAIPSANDYVWKISSEKIPHMTLLFLGEMPVANFADITRFMDHASRRSLNRFGMEVDRRGILGPEQADVLFFDKSKWSGYEEVAAYRSFLLQDSNIQAAYQSVKQFPEWLPHLTLGYPKSPAKPDNREYPGLSYVQFDRIALWFNDYEGFEYPLKPHEWDLEVAMGTISNRGQEETTKILMHYGKKGMKWGVRKKQTVPRPKNNLSTNQKIAIATFGVGALANKGVRTNVGKNRQAGKAYKTAKSQEKSERVSAVTVTQKKGGARLKAKGGKGRIASQDAVDAKMIAQIMKKSGVQSLSNKQLQDYNNRLNLEMSARRLNQQNTGAGRKFIADQLDLLVRSKG